ncbi:MAG: 5-formyltetrahydrofolate cyclo-ligase [Rhodothermales bacterium]
MTEGRTKRSDSDKDSLRSQFREYRTGLSESEYVRLSHDIVRNAIKLPELRRAGTVHLYWPVVEQREVDTKPLIRWLQRRRREIVLPVVLKFGLGNNDSPRLAHVRFQGEEALRLNRWGLLEPEPGPGVSLDEFDAVVVPALGAARDGHRVGYGLGYYDEFLAEVGVPKICLAYEACILDSVPFGTNDVPVDILVSEKTIYRTSCTPEDDRSCFT